MASSGRRGLKILRPRTDATRVLLQSLLRTPVSAVARRAKATVVLSLLTSVLLLPADAINAETIFDSVDLDSDTWAYAILSDPGISPNCDIAFAFDVPDTSDFTLDFLELRLGLATASAPNESFSPQAVPEIVSKPAFQLGERLSDHEESHRKL